MEYDINNIKMIISDVDGVWTDGSIYIGIKILSSKSLMLMMVLEWHC